MSLFRSACWISGRQLKWFMRPFSIPWLLVYVYIWRIPSATGKGQLFKIALRAPFAYFWISFRCTMHTFCDKHVAVRGAELRVERRWITGSQIVLEYSVKNLHQNTERCTIFHDFAYRSVPFSLFLLISLVALRR